METETRTTPGRPHTAQPHLLVIQTEHGAVGVTRPVLERIVQAAYEQHGILAQPWVAADEAPVERIVQGPGPYCRCGSPNCSDAGR